MSRKYWERFYTTSDKVGSRVDEIDIENFNRILKMHPHFPELIAAFKEEPDAYDTFIAVVRFVFLFGIH